MTFLLLPLFVLLIQASSTDDIPEPTIAYNASNPFYDVTNIKSPKFGEDNLTYAFQDRNPRVHTHVLVIPRGENSQFVQFWDMIKRGTDEQLVAFFRQIHQVATNAHLISSQGDARDLVKYGYRVTMNNYGSATQPNHASQVIPHLHAHVGGGECLAPVTKAGEVVNTCHSAIKRDEELVKVQTFDGFKILTYHALATEELPDEFIFEMVSPSTRKHLFASIHDFAEKATAKQIRTLGKLVIKKAQSVGFLKSGFRIYSNHGADAHQNSESHFRLHAAYGTWLPATLTNCMGINASYSSPLIKVHDHFAPEKA